MTPEPAVPVVQNNPAPSMTTEELKSRTPTLGLLAAILLAVLGIAGGIFTFGTRYGSSDTATASAVEAQRAALAGLREDVLDLATRLRNLEDVKTLLAPSVSQLAAQVEKLSEAVQGVKENLAAQTAETRNLKEAVSELRAVRAPPK